MGHWCIYSMLKKQRNYTEKEVKDMINYSDIKDLRNGILEYMLSNGEANSYIK
jgi:hypothetical protein